MVLAEVLAAFGATGALASVIEVVAVGLAGKAVLDLTGYGKKQAPVNGAPATG